jgi:hypothetical protein
MLKNGVKSNHNLDLIRSVPFSHQRPTTQQAQTFWVSQLGEWDCWLAAFRMALRFWGYDFDYAQLLNQLLGTGLRISEEYGAFFPYVALMASRLGFHGWLRCPLKNLPELANLQMKGHIGLERSILANIASECRQINYPRSYLYESLILLLDTSFARTCKVYKTPRRPSLEDILYFVELGLPVIVYVHCDNFYKLPNDDSGHLLTFIPVSDVKRKYIILDGYCEFGYTSFPRWEQHLKAADEFDWTKWSDWLLTIVPTVNTTNHHKYDGNSCENTAKSVM